MIGSFWNLCRACPSMPIDKQLHSEYRSTYTWHEYTGPHQEHTVVRRAPQPPPTSTKQASAKLQSAKSTEDENSEGPTLEPPLPRRKKCPELAYKTHEFITAADGGGIDAVDSNLVADKVREVTATSALPPSQLSKAISRISTEYRLQFAWPRRAQLANGDAVAAVNIAGGAVPTSGPPRKSLSMGALKQGIAPTGPAPVHKKRPGDIDHKRDGIQASELEPLVGTDTLDGVVPEADEREDDTSDLKITFRGKKSGGRTVRIMDGEEKVTNVSQEKPFPTSEVIELRRLADEYKHRDWGCGLAAEDEASLWKRVSSNHALNALSLARSVTKEEKEKENTRKIAPVPTTVMMPPAGRPSSVQARPIHGILQDESKDNEKAIARARKDFLIRHHLDRTTGVGKLYEGDGALLPSPTREKLEPVIPRRREDSKEHREEIQPRTKSSPKNSPRTGRSQSLGPSIAERRSPKRQPPRTPSVAKDVKEKDKDIKDKDREQREKSSERERHPRPTFLATTAPSHRPLHHVKPSVPTKTATTIISTAILNSTSTTVKPPIKHAIHTAVHHPPSSLPTSSAVDAAAAAIPSNRVTVIGKVADVVVSAGTGAVVGAAARPDRVKDLNRSQDQNEGQTKVASGHSLATAAVSTVADSSKSYSNSRYVSNKAATAVKAMTAEPQINGDVTGGESSAASTPPSQTRPIPAAPPVATSPWIDDEPVVKSPPEPTRVKSPEQMIMRSPEPVNWTVPLDTGKTFTVTQNVREEPLTRPHSEAKTWAPSSVPSAPQSAPPELAAQHKSQHSGYKSPESESVSLGSFSGINEQKDPESEGDSPFPLSSYVKESATPGTITPISAPASLQDEKESIVTDPDSKRQYRQEPLVKPVAGTNLKCLEDPVFEFERKSDVLPPTTTTGITTPTSTSVGQQQGYRVLEAEPYQGGTNAGVAGRNGVSEVGGMVSNMGGGYHVLEAPSVQTPVGPGTAQRSTASDVLEKARNRFDKFWGKGNGAEN